MKYRKLTGTLAAFSVSFLAMQTIATAQDKEAKAEPKAETPAAPAIAPEEVKPTSSYALGYSIGSNFARDYGRFGLTADDLASDKFLEGFVAALKTEKPALNEEKLQAAMQALGQSLQAREKATGEKNLKDSDAFLAENGKREGVVTTKSGLQYEVINKGGEKKYKEKDGENKMFLVHYKGTLPTGKQFDASPEGEAVPMTLQVIPGFKEALTTMPIGAKWKLFIPAKLAYGEERRSSDIGPNQALVFELELTDIKDAPAQPEMPLQLPPHEGAQGAPQEAPAPAEKSAEKPAGKAKSKK